MNKQLQKIEDKNMFCSEPGMEPGAALNKCVCQYEFCTKSLVSPLPVFTPEGTIGLPSVRPSVCPSVRPSVCLSVCPLKSGSFDNF